MTSGEGEMTTMDEKPTTGRLISGPGMLLVWFYGVMVVGAVSRSVYQIATEFDRAPLAYSLSAVAGGVYRFITASPIPGCAKAPSGGQACCAPPPAGVLVVWN